MTITPNLSFEDYRKIDALNSSGMKHLEQSPAHYRWSLDHPDEEESDALRIGRLAHTAILEPEKFAAQASVFATRPDGMKFNTKEGKAWKKVQTDIGKVVVEVEEHAILFGSVERIRQHPTASRMIGDPNGQAEVTLVSELEGVPVKARLDWLPSGDTIVDLKTTIDASPRGFAKTIDDRAYHRQAALYFDIARSVGLPIEHFCFLALEKSAPFEMGCYILAPEAISQGRSEYLKLLKTFADCRHANKWPGYSQALEPISIPAWRFKSEP